MKILIGADLVPTEGNIKLFSQGEKQKLLGNELADIMDHADFRIFNLEVPLTDSDSPILKEGPNLWAPTKSAQGFRSIGVNLFTLANNHILDQGEQGLRSTIQTLDHVGIHHVGAGLNLREAEKPYYFVENEKRFGIYACAEHEFSIAGQESPGANPFDPLDTPDKIEETKFKCDYLIVLYHGGKEHYRYPSPNLQRTCRKFIEKGADLVVCQHSHCIGCKEDYLNGIIVYGQGNFLFDSQSNEFWNTGLLLSVSEEGNVGYIPLRKEGSAVRLAVGDDAEKILSEFEKRSGDIQREGFIDQQYLDFAEKSINDYLFFLTGKRDNLIFKIANKLSGYRFQDCVARRYGGRVWTGLRNFVECEAHRELFLKGLEQQWAKPGESERKEEEK